MPHDEEVLTVSQVALLLKVYRATVYALIRNGRLPATRIGRGYKIYRPHLEAFLDGAASQMDARHDR